jgi:hypothetical protein
MAWDPGWDMVDALGSIGTGIAAAWVAWAAHHAARAADRRADERTNRSARAFAVTAAVEVFDCLGRANLLRDRVDALLGDRSPEQFASLYATVRTLPSVTMSSWLVTSPSVGDLPEMVSVKLSAAVATSDLMQIQLQQTDLIMHATGEPDGPVLEVIVRLQNSVRRFIEQLEEVQPMLHAVAITPTLPAHTFRTPFVRAWNLSRRWFARRVKGAG